MPRSAANAGAQQNAKPAAQPSPQTPAAVPPAANARLRRERCSGTMRQTWRATTCSACVSLPHHHNSNCRGPFAHWVTFDSPAAYSAAWHHQHLYAPRSLNLDSDMPAYKFLYEKTPRWRRTIMPMPSNCVRGRAGRRLGNRSDLRREMSRCLFDVAQSITSVERSEIRCCAAGRIARCG